MNSLENKKTDNNYKYKNVINFPEVWMKELDISTQGNIRNTIPNFVIILKNDKMLKDKLRLNEHSQRVEIKCDNGSRGLSNLDLSKIKHRIEGSYGIYNKEKLGDALEIVASEDSYHPIKEYLESVESNDLYLLKNYISEVQTPWSIKSITDPIKVACKNNYLIDIIDIILEERLEAKRQKSGV